LAKGLIYPGADDIVIFADDSRRLYASQAILKARSTRYRDCCAFKIQTC